MSKLGLGKPAVSASLVLVCASVLGILILDDEGPFGFSQGDDDEHGEFLSSVIEINLSDPALNTLPAGVTFAGTAANATLTFTESSDEMYNIIRTGTGTGNIGDRQIVIGAGVSVGMTFTNIHFSGNITLQDNAALNLYLANSNTINGSILVRTGQTLKIDSASSPGTGSTAGSLSVSPTQAIANGNAAIGGAVGNPGQTAGTIIIDGGTVIATPRPAAGNNAAGAGIGGGGGSSADANSAGGGGGTVIINPYFDRTSCKA